MNIPRVFRVWSTTCPFTGERRRHFAANPVACMAFGYALSQLLLWLMKATL